MNFEHQADLLNEPLSDSEVRTLLERLGSAEFGGSEEATLRAVVEATGSDARTVGRLLAEIRKEDFEKRFGLQLREHGRRIDILENGAREERKAWFKPPRTNSEPELDPYQKRALDRLAEEERRKEAIGPIVTVVVAALVIFFMLAAGGVCDSTRGEFDTNSIYPSTDTGEVPTFKKE